MNDPRRLAHLDGLRALAAVYVVVHHAVYTVYPFHKEGANGPLQPFTHAVDVAFGMAHYAVTAFIVLSGYSLALAVRDLRLRAGVRGFLLSRAARIVLPYWCALALSTLMALTVVSQRTGTSHDLNLPVDWTGTLVHALLLQDVVPGNSANGVFWTIAIEWHIYFTMPLLLLSLRRRGPAATVTTWLLTSYLVYVLLHGGPLAGTTPQYYAMFALGAVAHLAYVDRPDALRAIRRLAAWAVPGSAVLAAVLIVSPLGREQQNSYVDLFVGVTLALTLAGLAHGALPRLRRLLSVGPLAMTGAFAYSLYLMHGPLQQWGWQLLVRPLDLGTDAALLMMLVVVGPLVGAVCYLFYLLCEQPFHRLSRRLGQAAAPSPAEVPAQRTGARTAPSTRPRSGTT